MAFDPFSTKEGCNRPWLVSCHQARKSGENRWSFSYCTVVCTEQSFFVEKKTTEPFAFVGDSPFFYKKRLAFFYGAKLIFRSFATFF